MLTGVLETVLPVAAMLLLGALIRRTGLLEARQVQGLRSLVLHITLPAVLFLSFSTASYSLNSLLWPALMFLCCLAAMGLGKAAAGVLGLPGPVPFLTSGYEAGMLGYALFALLAGEGNTASFAIIDLGQVLFVFTVYKALLDSRAGNALPGGQRLRALLVSPMILAIAAGVLLGASGAFRALERLGVGAVLGSVAAFIARPTAALVLLAVGYDLVPGEVRWRETARVAALRLAISGLLMGVMLLVNARLLHGGPMITRAIVLMFLLPPPFVLPMFADDPEQRAGVSSVLSALTLVALAAFAVLTATGL